MPIDFEVTMNEYLPLRDVVFNTLRRAILRGELKPGERLMEIQLANKLGVSRTPIREAIRKLELEGLVLMIPRKGAEVTEKNLRDVLEVRCALEELAVQLACDRINQEEIHELHAAAARFEQMFDSDDITSIAQADEAFHDVIFQATDNERLIQLLNNLREQMYRYRIEYLKKKECYPQLIAEHEAIMQAIEGHDKAMATQITGQHINNQVDTVFLMYKRKRNVHTLCSIVIKTADGGNTYGQNKDQRSIRTVRQEAGIRGG